MIDKINVQPLLIAADMLQLKELIVGCTEYLKGELHNTNALGIFRFVIRILILYVTTQNIPYSIASLCRWFCVYMSKMY